MGCFKLGKMTFGSLFKKPETIQYPAQVKEPHPGLKGHVYVEPDKCILCGICSKRCPCHAITVDKPNREWRINHFMCVQCYSCVRECPKGCLVMDPHYPTPTVCKEDEVIAIPEQSKA